MDLDIKQLNRVHADRDKNRRAVYESVYYRCRDKILYVNNNLYQKECWYKIPSIVWGLPLFNVKGCICYLMLRFKKQEFKVRYKHPNWIHISWDINKKENEESKDNINSDDPHDLNTRINEYMMNENMKNGDMMNENMKNGEMMNGNMMI